MQTQMFVHEERPRIWIRLIIGAIILLILWFLGTQVLSFFDFSSQQKAGAVLSIDENPDGVQVSLQGGDVQRGEDQLKVYEGDTIYTSNGGNAVLIFFDGTKLRMDQQSQLTLEESSRMTEKPSVLTLDLPKGRIFLMTPSQNVFTGSITRTVKTDTQSISIPHSASALISDDVLAVTESSGLGLTSLLELPSGSSKEIVIGEGQVLALTPSARTSIESGSDPYTYRRTFGEKESTDLFLKESMTALSSQPLPSTGSGSIESSSRDSDVLNVQTPTNNQSVNGTSVTVSGTVGTQVTSVEINGTAVLIGSDQSFRQDVTLTAASVTLTISAKDRAGNVLETVSRTVTRTQTTVPMASVSKPVGSGGTFTTNQEEVTISGGAPANTNGIMVNDYALQLFKPGSRTWTYVASLALGNMKQGENRYEIRALDATGAKSNPVVITIVFKPDSQTSSIASSDASSLPSNNALMPGSLTVTAPGISPYETIQDDILIEGKTPAVTDSVYVNGYKLSLYTPGKDFWNYYAATKYGTLRPGRNTYTVVTRNKEGKILDSMQYVITYTPKTGQ